MVIRSTQGGDDWNAIDANIAIEEDGKVWLSFGSFWGGALDPAHFLLAPPAIAWNPFPHYGQEEVGTGTGEGNDVAVDLSWSTSMDAENNEQVNGEVTAHYRPDVYYRCPRPDCLCAVAQA